MESKHYIIAGVALMLLLAFAVFNKGSKPRYTWNESYKVKEKSPFGLHIIKELLGSQTEEGKVTQVDKKLELISDSLLTSTNNNYVFIGPAVFLDSLALERLLNFVQNGNTAFLASKSIPQELMARIYPEPCSEYLWEDYPTTTDSSATFNFYHPDLNDSTEYTFEHYIGKKKKEYPWSYIFYEYFCDSTHSLTELGYFDDSYVNFAKKEYGFGEFYLCTTPILFTNYHTIDSTGLDYAQNVFSHLDNGEIFWDETHKVPVSVGRRRNKRANSYANNPLITEGPLSYVLGNKSLKAAWYTLLAAALFFLIFRTRRKQRIIPVLEANRNTSLDFISTIGSLYFFQKDYVKLTKRQGQLFLNYIRTHYDLPTQHLDENFQARLAAKSEVSTETISKIFQLWKNLKAASYVSENSMIDFYKTLNTFYKTCK